MMNRKKVTDNTEPSESSTLQADDAVRRETCLTRQQGVPFSAGEMGLQPEGTDHTSDAETVETGDITGCGNQIQNGLS